MVEPQPSKLVMRFRLPSPALTASAQVRVGSAAEFHDIWQDHQPESCPNHSELLRLADSAQRLDSVQHPAQPILLDLQVVSDLQVHPEALRGAEVTG